MKIRFTAALTLASILATFIALLAFRTLPATKIWDSYTVLYVENSVTEQTVLSYLEQYGCRGTITRSAQKVPLVSSMVSLQPRQSTYLEDRLQYFRDESARYRLYYVPSAQQKQLLRAMNALVREMHVDAGMDGRQKYPWLVPLICLAAYLFLGIMSRSKRAFFIPAAFLLLLTLAIPFHTATAAVCLLLMVIFLLDSLWRRRKTVRAMLLNPYAWVLFASALAILFLESVRAGVLGILCMASALLSFSLLWQVQAALDAQRDFRFELIFSAMQLPVLQKKSARCMVSLTVPLLALVAVFLSSPFFSTAGETAIQGLSIPAPGEYTDTARALPTLEHYFDWAWKTLTFPYRSLNATIPTELVQEGETVQEVSYRQGTGGLEATARTLFTYDEAFRASMQKNIDSLGYAPIEKLLEEQGRTGSVAYNGGLQTKAPARQDGMSFVLLLMALAEPLLLYAAYYTTGRRKYENS